MTPYYNYQNYLNNYDTSKVDNTIGNMENAALNFSNQLGNMGNYNFSVDASDAARQRAEQATYQAFLDKMTPQFETQTSDLQNRLINQGLSLCRGTDRPDLIVTDDTMYSLFEESLTPLQRFSDSKTADAGFTNLLYKQVPVVFDGGHGGNCPKGHMYFLNTNYIYLRPHKDRQFKVIGGERMAINQDAIYKILGWAGNMTMSNAFTQGVLLDKSE